MTTDVLEVAAFFMVASAAIGFFFGFGFRKGWRAAKSIERRRRSSIEEVDE